MSNLKSVSRKLVTAASVRPVTLAEVKEALRAGDDEDDVLTRLIKAATGYTEKILSRALVSQTWDFYYDHFPFLGDDNGFSYYSDAPMQIPLPPIISVTSVKYYDENNAEQTWNSSNYVLDDSSEPALLYPAIDSQYPSTRTFPKSVIIRAVCGYEDSGASPTVLYDNVPEEIRNAIMMLVGHLYENKEATVSAINVNHVPLGYTDLLAPYKIWRF